MPSGNWKLPETAPVSFTLPINLKFNPSDELGALVQFFTGETGTYTMESGEKVSILVKRDAEGFYDSVGLTKTGEEEELNINIARYNNYHVVINIIATVLD